MSRHGKICNKSAYLSLYFPLEWLKFPFLTQFSQLKLFLLLLQRGQTSCEVQIVGNFNSLSFSKYSAILCCTFCWVLVLMIDCWSDNSMFMKQRLWSADILARDTLCEDYLTYKPKSEAKRDTMFQKIREWISLKNYQYQVTTGIYMLEPWERTIFSIL